MTNYPIYNSRKIGLLDGAWEFCFIECDTALDAFDPAKLKFDTIAVVPGVFELSPDLFSQRGIGFYRKKIILQDKAKHLKLKLGGLGLHGQIWWDNKSLGEIVLPYSGLNFALPEPVPGEHELIIAVDNRLHDSKADLFQSFYDFYGFGGIYRSVELHELPAYSIDRVKITPVDITWGLVKLDILLEGDFPAECEFKVGFDGREPKVLNAAIVNGKITLELNVPDFKLWSPENPSLHIVEFELNGDHTIERFGLRDIYVSKGEIFLNGKPLILRGFNRHESHPQFGPAQSWQLMLDDLKILKQLNCNFVRGAHYPMDQRFLDLCDQMGFLVWEESMGWNNKVEQLTDPDFICRQKAQTQRMIDNSYNHPSIIIWGFLNEAESNQKEALPLYRELSGMLRDGGGPRLISYASNRGENDLCLQYADIISMNIYPGWIDNNMSGGKAKDKIAPCINQLAQFAERKDLQEKALIISEIGTCALYGCHDLAAAQWSEEFQRDYMSEAVKIVLSHPRYSGICLWQMFDSRSYGDEGIGVNIRCKPRGYNSAGVIDEFRRPKLAASAIGELFKNFNYISGEK